MSGNRKRIDINGDMDAPGEDTVEAQESQPGSQDAQDPQALQDVQEPQAEKPREGGGEESADGGEDSELERVEAERDACREKLVRLQAEFENYRKRVQREAANAQAKGRSSLITEFLAIHDNLERALSAAEHHQEHQVLEGVRLTHSLFVDLLHKEGVEEIDPQGSAFDPELHEAMMAEPSDEEEGIVTKVFERGYMMDGRVLRPAKVVVSAGRSE